MPVSAGLANEKVAPVDFRPLFGRGRYARRMKRMTPLFAPLIMIGLALGWFAGEEVTLEEETKRQSLM